MRVPWEKELTYVIQISFGFSQLQEVRLQMHESVHGYLRDYLCFDSSGTCDQLFGYKLRKSVSSFPLV